MGERWKVVFMFLLLVGITATVCSVAETGGVGHKEEKKQGPEPVERALGLSNIRSRWDALKSWAKLKLMNLSPNSESYSTSKSGSSHHAGEVVKDAATKSLGATKETAEHTAKSAAEVVDGAVHKAKDKVKKTISSKPEAHRDDADL